MTPNSDNAMARFLFAILKQKNLKDIDWNQVAQDPVLLQPITNGHAARMRYSRFRTTVTTHDPHKRGRLAEKARVSKPKKEQQSHKKDVLIKTESAASLSPCAQYSPLSTTSHLGDAQDEFNTRFLTPCSDDIAQGVSSYPTVMETSGHYVVVNDFASAAEGSPDFLPHPGHPHGLMAHSPSCPPYDGSYDMSCYGSGHSILHNQELVDFGSTATIMDFSNDWSHHFHNTPHYDQP